MQCFRRRRYGIEPPRRGDAKGKEGGRGRGANTPLPRPPSFPLASPRLGGSIPYLRRLKHCIQRLHLIQSIFRWRDERAGRDRGGEGVHHRGVLVAAVKGEGLGG